MLKIVALIVVSLFVCGTTADPIPTNVKVAMQFALERATQRNEPLDYPLMEQMLNHLNQLTAERELFEKYVEEGSQVYDMDAKFDVEEAFVKPEPEPIKCPEVPPCPVAPKCPAAPKCDRRPVVIQKAPESHFHFYLVSAFFISIIMVLFSAYLLDKAARDVEARQKVLMMVAQAAAREDDEEEDEDEEEDGEEDETQVESEEEEDSDEDSDENDGSDTSTNLINQDKSEEHIPEPEIPIRPQSAAAYYYYESDSSVDNESSFEKLDSDCDL